MNDWSYSNAGLADFTFWGTLLLSVELLLARQRIYVRFLFLLLSLQRILK